MEAWGYRLILLLAASGGPLHPGVPHQTRVQTLLSEVHAPRYPGPDLSGLADARRLCKNNVGKDEGSIGVPTPVENTPPFRGQDCREAAPTASEGVAYQLAD